MLRSALRVSFSLRRSFGTSFARRKDPWPLANTPEHLAGTVTPPDLSPLKPLERTNETPEILRARLIYQSRKRGTLETDLLLSTFARDYLASMTVAELQEYDKVSLAVATAGSGCIRANFGASSAARRT